MTKFTQEQRELQAKLVSGGMSKAFAYQLATGRRTPSMKLARRLHTELGISPMVWIDLSERKEAAND
jgi:antitoxin component HigA of HigAB toxin-antitoxin module